MNVRFQNQDEFLLAGALTGKTTLDPLKTPANATVAVAFVVEDVKGDTLNVTADSVDGITASLYRLSHVPVLNNTADEVVYGCHVFAEPPAEKPAYCFAKAPFNVYEPMHPLKDGVCVVDNGVAVVYLTLDVAETVSAGIYTVSVTLADESGNQTVAVTVDVRGVSVPKEEHCSIANWFSLQNMATYHGLTLFSDEHMAMIRNYAKMMRRTRQTHFFLTTDLVDRLDTTPATYDFSRLKAVMDIFWEEGFSTMEFGYLGTRPHISDPELTTPFKKDVIINSTEGFFESENFVRALGKFICDEGINDKTVFHISDEPDEPISCLSVRKTAYFMLGNLLRKYIPNARVIEAVKSTEFRGGVDIYVPLSRVYEQNREDFDNMKNDTTEVWYYVCCAPGVGYLNRFLDCPLISSRLLFWALYRYNLSGYLHWGFNQYEKGQDPFVCTSPPHAYGNGVLLPSGDGFMVYPGEEGPLSCLRLEEQRRGACDYELLRLLGEKNPEKAMELATRAVTSFDNYVTDIDEFNAIYDELLTALEAVQ